MKKILISALCCMLFSLAVTAQMPSPAVMELSSKFFKETDLTAKENLILEMLKVAPNENVDLYYFSLAMDAANAKRNDKSIYFIGKAKADMRVNALVRVFPIIIANDVKLADQFVVGELAKPNLTSRERLTLLNAYSTILSNMGNHKKAFEVGKEYYDLVERKNPAINGKYYALMSKAGQYQAAFPELEKSILDGAEGQDLKDELKVAYTKLNPGKDGNAFLAGMDNRTFAVKKAEVVKEMIKVKSPAFTVTDANGKPVSLADLKGNVVVLDFWATWCGPCKAALPAMQATVNKYKNDPKVKFLFIHTWERSANPTAEAKQYFADNKYNLPLYMDLKDEATKKNNAIEGFIAPFKVAGIPAKFVIDANGDVRFSVIGFSGTEQAAVSELSAMIELSRQSI